MGRIPLPGGFFSVRYPRRNSSQLRLLRNVSSMGKSARPGRWATEAFKGLLKAGVSEEV